MNILPRCGLSGAIALLFGFCFTAQGETIQIGNLQVPLSNLQLIDSNSIPESGTFYLLKDALEYGGSSVAPCPDDPFPEFPVYYLGIDNVHLVDNTGITDETIEQILCPLFITPDPNGSNVQPIIWPVSLDGLPLVDPTNTPESGTFYLYQDQFASDPPDPAPYPFIPNFAQSAPLYALSTNGQFLIDDTGIIRPDPGPGPEYHSPSFGTNLALNMTGVSNYVAYLFLTNTVPGVNYDILYKQNLGDPVWGYAGTISGTSDTNATPFVIPVGSLSTLYFWAQVDVPEPGLMVALMSGDLSSGYLDLVLWNTIPDQPYQVLTNSDLAAPLSSWGLAASVSGAPGNSTTVELPADGIGNLFVCARFAGDGDGNGIPDWWELQNFSYVGIDPYAPDSSGDGWTYLQDYQKGFIPGSFNTPPAPQGIVLKYDCFSGAVSMKWNPSPGWVIGYKVTRILPGGGIPKTFLLSSNVQFLADIFPQNNPDPAGNNPMHGPPITPSYSVQALYSAGASSQASASIFDPSTALTGQKISGRQSESLLSIQTRLSPNIITLRLNRYYLTNSVWIRDIFDIAATNLVDGLVTLPDAIVEPANVYLWWLQAITSDHAPSSATLVDEEESPIPFFDGRQQLGQNLRFLLRIANTISPFTFYANDTGHWVRHGNPTNYAYSGLYAFTDLSSGTEIATFDEFKPFKDNYMFHNFVLTLSDVGTDGTLTTGANYDEWGLGVILASPSTYEFQVPTNQIEIPAILGDVEAQWTTFLPQSTTYYADFDLIGMQLLNGTLSMFTDSSNFFGLPFVSGILAYNQSDHLEVHPGDSIQVSGDGGIYVQTAIPTLQTVDYYFADAQTDLLPGNTDFCPTNHTPILLASVNHLSQYAGYAKQRILNGSGGQFAYLGQYFDSAYAIDSSGSVTTNSAGVLSQYGIFLPKMPGSVALLTMTNTDWPYERGTGTVNVIKLQLDVNHDGIMDLSFDGPDNTSETRPFVFWINNDNDGTNIGADLPIARSAPADYLYGRIRSWRNLEDFARLWVCGLPQLPTSDGYSITFRMVPSSGNPAINLYAATTNNSAYLSDTNAAQAQFAQQTLNGQVMFDYSIALGQISSNQTYTLPVLSNGRSYYTNFLFEGAGTGAGELTLTISQTNAYGSNVLAESSIWLDLHDIKDFYEEAAITNITAGAFSNWSSSVEMVQYATSTALSDDTNLIVFVHGIGVNDSDWLIESDTIFKRLYWAGYHGAFSTVKWPCNFLLPPKPPTPDVFNLSERNAYKASVALNSYVQQLRARFPGYRVHILAHSQGNAVVSEAIEQGLICDTYILSQAALPACAYDVSSPTNQDLLWYENNYIPTPDWRPIGYHGIYTNLTGQLVNLYNPIDYALATGTAISYSSFQLIAINWITDQKLSKPSLFYRTDGTNCWYVGYDTSYTVTDSEEARSMVSRSRTMAIGAQGLTQGEIKQGIIGSTIDLNAQFGFGRTVDEHSAQWTRPIQTSRPYFQQVLTSCEIQPAP